MEQNVSLESLVSRHLNWMAERHYSEKSLKKVRSNLMIFVEWCHQRDLRAPQEITPTLLKHYQRFLYLKQDDQGRRLSARYQWDQLSTLKRFFRWSHKEGFLLLDPAHVLERPRLPQRLPRNLLSVEQIEKILQIPDLETPWGLRDRAMLEVFYATAIRKSELLNLRSTDLERGKLMLLIRSGKGNKDRMAPITARALSWLERYEISARDALRRPGRDEDALFLSQRGNRLSEAQLHRVIHEAIHAVLPDTEGSCHLFRHSVATLLLENGCDIRYIQEFLGHSHLSSTQIYTQVAQTSLRNAYQQFHPQLVEERKRQAAKEPLDEERKENSGSS